jgi:hypothetical protein
MMIEGPLDSFVASFAGIARRLAEQRAEIERERRLRIIRNLPAQPSRVEGEAIMWEGMMGAALSALYGYSAYNAAGSPAQQRAALLHRLQDKETRMERRMARRREQIWKRNWMIMGLCFFWLTVPFLTLASIAAVWRFCAWVIAT